MVADKARNAVGGFEHELGEFSKVVFHSFIFFFQVSCFIYLFIKRCTVPLDSKEDPVFVEVDCYRFAFKNFFNTFLLIMIFYELEI